MTLGISQVSWYADIVNLIVSGDYLLGATTQQKKKLNHDAKFYIWDVLVQTRCRPGSEKVHFGS